MLDLDHPETPHVFAASRQLELILDYCKRITLGDAAGRKFMVEIIRPSFVALRWLNRERFGRSGSIASAIDQVEQQVDALARLPLLHFESRRGLPPAQCPACGAKPMSAGKYDATPYCPTCLGIVMPALDRVESSEEGFGTDAI